MILSVDIVQKITKQPQPPGLGVTKPISPVIFLLFSASPKCTLVIILSCWYLTDVAAAQLRRHLSNINAMQRIYQVLMQDGIF